MKHSQDGDLRFTHKIEIAIWKSPQERTPQVTVDFRMSEGMLEKLPKRFVE